VNAVAVAITSWLLVVAHVDQAAQATVWLTGSLNGRGWEHVVPVALALAVLMPAGLLVSSDSARWRWVTTPPAASACGSTGTGSPWA